ncbi:MAG: alpha/beta hydrolase [Desulfobacteraceae bacterium]|jgi:alpha-beta hydrolase superfamily lysophospholipase|nr:alpha/beta hydrolase [Desulfobacteraceae bacterium]
MTGTHEETDRFESGDGTTLFYRKYTPEKERFRVVVSHGLGEHSGRYGHVVDTLCPMGASLWIHDHRGHGRSQGKRGHINEFDDYLKDLKALIEMAEVDRTEGLPLLLLGHSMGGLIALSVVRKHLAPIDGLIVSSPLLGVPKPPPLVLSAVARVLSVVWPTLHLDNQLDPTLISHDDAEVKAYVQSKWVHSKISARWFTRCMAEIDATVGSPEAIGAPILMQIAGDDHLVSAPAALAYFDALTVADKTLFHYETLYHEIYNERLPERDKVLADLSQWVADRFL